MKAVIAALALGLTFTSPTHAVSTIQVGAANVHTETEARQDYDAALNHIRAGQNLEALPLLEKALQSMPENRRLQGDYLLCLTWIGEYGRAVNYFLPREEYLKKITYIPRNIGKAFYELRDYSKALELYRLGLSYDQKDEESFKGVIYSFLRLGDASSASAAYLQGREAGLISPKSLDAAKTTILERYGASIEALEIARKSETGGQAQLESLELDSAVTRLRWGEFKEAAAEIERVLARDQGNLRARGDYIVVLRKMNRMSEVLVQFEIFQKTGEPIPFWVSEAVAEAYLHLRRPEEAEVHFRMALEKEPGNFNVLTGLFNTYTDQRQWDKSTEILREIETLTEKSKNPTFGNWLILTKGWLLLNLNRIKEGEEYFQYYLREAASDTALRSGIAHAYSWRNRPRKAMEQFEINRNLDPQDYGSLTGLAWTLNELNFKPEARELAGELRRSRPTEPFTEDLWMTLQAEDMWRVEPEIRYVNEFNGGSEYLGSLLLEKPLTPALSLFTRILRQETSSTNGGSTTRSAWNRSALGFRWIAAPELILTESISADYLRWNDFGSDTRIQWWPTDPLRINAEYSSFSLDVPLRARLSGVNAQQASVDILYLESDLREYDLSAGAHWFTDNNMHSYGALRYDQSIFTDPDFKLRAGLEVSAGSYTKQDRDYYSPGFEWKTMLTSTLRYINLMRYEKRWLSEVYLRAGISGEKGFATLPVTGITFEQNYTHSKRFSITGNVSYDLKAYDGEYTNALGTYLSFDWRF